MLRHRRAARFAPRCSLLIVALLAAASPAAAATPPPRVTAIVQFHDGVSPGAAHRAVARVGGSELRDVPLIDAVAARMTPAAVRRLEVAPQVHAVSLDAPVRPRSLVNFDANKMATSFNQSANVHSLWNKSTGRDVGVAVIDTGIDGGLTDFRESVADPSSRVVASAVVNPYATSAGDSYGHGTHVAGILAGNGGYRIKGRDALWGKYAGAAPDANLISVKVSDEAGSTTILDVIYGIQFAVDNKDRLGIRVINLSLESTVAQSYRTDPLDAAAEAAWFSGIVVVAAAGNRGAAGDAVGYAPGNDPYVISVGAVDDRGSKNTKDDLIPAWSSRGVTQDGFAKPDIYAPGAQIVSSLASGSAFGRMCSGCIVSTDYIRAGGTSMSAPVISGIAADILALRPTWTPDMVKGAILNTARTLKNGGREVNAANAANASTDKLVSNRGLTPSTLLDGTTRTIDPTKASWVRSKWTTAAGDLSAAWARSSWTCACSLTGTGEVDPARSKWTAGSWSTSWGL